MDYVQLPRTAAVSATGLAAEKKGRKTMSTERVIACPRCNSIYVITGGVGKMAPETGGTFIYVSKGFAFCNYSNCRTPDGARLIVKVSA